MKSEVKMLLFHIRIKQAKWRSKQDYVRNELMYKAKLSFLNLWLKLYNRKLTPKWITRRWCMNPETLPVISHGEEERVRQRQACAFCRGLMGSVAPKMTMKFKIVKYIIILENEVLIQKLQHLEFQENFKTPYYCENL